MYRVPPPIADTNRHPTTSTGSNHDQVIEKGCRLEQQRKTIQPPTMDYQGQLLQEVMSVLLLSAHSRLAWYYGINEQTGHPMRR